MKRKGSILIAFTGIMLLAGCGGNSLGLDDERLLQATKDRAMSYADIKEGDYTEDDIELMRVCPAVREDEQDFDHAGDYLIFWQTTDDNNRNIDLMNESDYEVGSGANRYMIQDEGDCIDY